MKLSYNELTNTRIKRTDTYSRQIIHFSSQIDPKIIAKFIDDQSYFVQIILINLDDI